MLDKIRVRAIMCRVRARVRVSNIAFEVYIITAPIKCNSLPMQIHYPFYILFTVQYLNYRMSIFSEDECGNIIEEYLEIPAFEASQIIKSPDSHRHQLHGLYYAVRH